MDKRHVMPKMIIAAVAILLYYSCNHSFTEHSANLELLSSWEFSENISSGGRYVVRLSFNHDLKFVEKITNYGLYPGDDTQSLSAWSEIDGTYRIEDNKLIFSPKSLTTWDSFYSNPGPTVIRPYPYGSIFDDCTYRIETSILTLTYLTYPADAPIVTTRSFIRKK